MKRFLATLLKIGLSAAILAYLFAQARANEVFVHLRDQPKRWEFFAAAWLLCAAAVVLTIIRWRLLVRALGTTLSVRNALRIGFVGYLFNLAPMGIVGGDVLKAVMLAHEQPVGRMRALATVAMDRALGLYVLFLIASAAILATGLHLEPVPRLRHACHATLLVALAGTAGMVILQIPAVTEGRLAQRAEGLPKVGPALSSLLGAFRLYRRQPGVLLAAAAMSVVVHSLFTLGVYLIAHGLSEDAHTLGAHFAAVPLSSAAGVIPLPLGPFEAVLDFLYAAIPGRVRIPAGQGLVVALAYRIVTVLVAAVGIGYYLGARREVSEVLQEAQQADVQRGGGEG